MNKDNYAVIMAGGVGSRFWPVSKVALPKQFHDILGTGETLIQRTYTRLTKSVPPQNILVLTNELYKDLVLTQLPEISSEQVVTEPAMRNTAPCILYAAIKIQKMNPNAVMVVAPSDHWIEDEDAFTRDLITCFKACSEEPILMTLGITPTFPNTGFGYIEYDKNTVKTVRKISQFREKPDYPTAQEFLKSGNYLWNAGIFIWSVQSIITAFKNFQPTMTALFEKGSKVYNTPEEKDFISKNYAVAENISIDYAILEDATNVHVLEASFDWNDLGAWGSLYDKMILDTPREDQNVIVNARILANDAVGNMIRTDGDKIVVIDGLNDFVVVDSEEVLLIFPKEKEQEIKSTRQKVKDSFGEKYI